MRIFVGWLCCWLVVCAVSKSCKYNGFIIWFQPPTTISTIPTTVAPFPNFSYVPYPTVNYTRMQCIRLSLSSSLCLRKLPFRISIAQFPPQLPCNSNPTPKQPPKRALTHSSCFPKPQYSLNFYRRSWQILLPRGWTRFCCFFFIDAKHICWRLEAEIWVKNWLKGTLPTTKWQCFLVIIKETLMHFPIDFPFSSPCFLLAQLPSYDASFWKSDR